VYDREPCGLAARLWLATRETGSLAAVGAASSRVRLKGGGVARSGDGGAGAGVAGFEADGFGGVGVLEGGDARGDGVAPCGVRDRERSAAHLLVVVRERAQQRGLALRGRRCDRGADGRRDD